MKDRIDFLIELLFDEEASVAERDDAAMALAQFNDDRVIQALIAIARKKNEDELILNSCGESLGSLWFHKNAFDEQVYHTLSSTSRYGIYYVISSRKPEWIRIYNLNSDKFL